MRSTHLFSMKPQLSTRRLALFAAVAVFAGATGACASKSGGAQSTLTGATGGSQIVSGGDMSQSGRVMNLAATVTSSKVDIPLKMDEAWTRLEAAYNALGIKLTDHNAASHFIGNVSFKARRKVGDIQLTNAIDCGGSSSAPNAESYDIVMGVRSQLTMSSANVVQLETFVEGVGRNPLTNNSVPAKCSTLGLFESRIADMVKNGVPPNTKK